MAGQEYRVLSALLRGPQIIARRQVHLHVLVKALRLILPLNLLFRNIRLHLKIRLHTFQLLGLYLFKTLPVKLCLLLLCFVLIDDTIRNLIDVALGS